MFHRNAGLGAATMAALTALLGACSASTATHASTDSPTGRSTGSPAVADGPIDLKPIDAGTELEPGRYAVPFWDDDGPARAVVDVPEGYFSAGGWVIDDGHGTLAPDEFGDLLFLSGNVGRVDTQPCRRGRLVKPGPGVDGLAQALATAQGRSTRPRPVTLDGHRGLYLVVSAPKDVTDCPGGEYALIRQADGDWFGADMSGTREHLWILDVDGRRVVAIARVVPGHTDKPAQLVQMAESARFVPSL